MARRPILNPLLTLVTPPQPKPAPGGGKGAKDIREQHYERRRKHLIKSFSKLAASAKLKRCAKADRVLVRVIMDDKSLAPSYAPGDLFSPEYGAELVAPWRHGYLAEVSAVALARLGRRLTGDRLPIATKVDVSRVKAVSLLATDLMEMDFEELWARATVVDGRTRLFLGSPAPFRSEAGREELFAELSREMVYERLRYEDGDRGGDYADDTETIGTEQLVPITPAFPVTGEALRAAVSQRGAFVTVACSSVEILQRLVASGAIVKWDPVQPLVPTRASQISLPDQDPPTLRDAPIVGVIDGGLLPGRYEGVTAWAEQPLVPDRDAARDHGTRVASLVVEAERWGNSLQLPATPCRIGVVQAVAAADARFPFVPNRFLQHVASAMARHRDTRVWNVSANLPGACDDVDVSPLAHALAQIAREFDNTIVISAGNRDGDECRISPPADCEAGIVVTGRLHDHRGWVAGACPECRTGLGPDNMLKPELSWYSNHALPDGSVIVGTSYAAPLVSRLAAHTWLHLKEPNSDLVKAILVGAGDLGSFQHELGFGSPIAHALPWESPPGSVVLARKAQLKAGSYYYWRDIMLPATMVDRSHLVGRLRLTAVLAPEVTLTGSGNYFASRLQTGLQFENHRHDWSRLIGSLPVETAEGLARAEDAKWQPTRCYEGRFVHPDDRSRKDGLMSCRLGGRRLRVYARTFERDVFARDGLVTARDRDHDVAFVLTMEDANGDPSTFDSFVQAMGNRVQSAIIDQEVSIDA
ncbi:MAG: S8 family serine peptidase [Fulvimarina manganoxydans]|uniref:S8 family serine peptidase n=1 Tax=Fulvimarina manganoxydans TaxID=937218 RepID=UPI002352A075|nr:S8 family serine peptidase [Fulvimarina manganoxydans]MCK5934367.1 S8 family serine peptidase [Fulvimarina manganoxydans]